MILCCPACQTQFKVDSAQLGPDGRKVRCTKCSHVWRVGPDGNPVATGQFGMKSSKPATQPAVAAETPAQQRGPAETAPGAAANEQAAPAGGRTDTGGAALDKQKDGDAADTPEQQAATGEGTTGQAVRQSVRQAKARKGGRKFKVSLLILCLAVIGLFIAGVITDRIRLGGKSPSSSLPATGDVTPPASDGND